MREAIHPKYEESVVLCACGCTFKTRSTRPSIKLEICSNCHPFFTGKQKFIDTAGRVEKFQKRFAKTGGKTVLIRKADKRIQTPRKTLRKVLTNSPKKQNLL
ncbi:MAG: 50S ribosomal protein L31 [Endomicrobium sp.]|jgi:large subunit ribosomal protein L31|nr:50S ribosomal protein L31 [Endomicrobium sp.]